MKKLFIIVVISLFMAGCGYEQEQQNLEKNLEFIIVENDTPVSGVEIINIRVLYNRGGINMKLVQPLNVKAGRGIEFSIAVQKDIANTHAYIKSNFPETRERESALAKLEEASFWVVAAETKNVSPVSP